MLSGFFLIFDMIFNRFSPPRDPVKINQSNLFALGSLAISSKKSASLLLKGICGSRYRKYKKHYQSNIIESN